MDAPSVCQQRVTDLLVPMERWRRCCPRGISAARVSANQVAAEQEVPWDRCRLLRFCAALQKSAARRM